jgi:hypothetical protein
MAGYAADDGAALLVVAGRFPHHLKQALVTDWLRQVAKAAVVHRAHRRFQRRLADQDDDWNVRVALQVSVLMPELARFAT